MPTTPFQNLPLHPDRGRAWDAGAAKRRVLRWASDARGNVDWPAYRRAFFWYDRENAEIAGGHKLPFADIVTGQLTAIFRGVAAAAGALSGGRGGVDLPAQDRAPTERHVTRYYAKARKQYDDDGIQSPFED